MHSISALGAASLLVLAQPAAAQGPDTTAAHKDLRFTAITVGGAHSCALTADSVAYCWGRNQSGQLGDSSEIDRSTPVRVSGGIAFQQITAGAEHTCGVDGFGAPYCWGKNDSGQGGTGLTGGRSYPVQVVGRQRMNLIAAGAEHTCGTIRHWEHEDRLYCWGHNSHGQLGNREVRSAAAPAPAFGTIKYTSIAAGSRHSCGVSAAGTVFCWGANERGQLGNGSVTQSNVPFPIRVSRRVTFTSVTVGEAHSCALTSEGEAYCWGRNAAGQLGTGKRGGQSIMPSRLDRALRFAALSAGGDATCGVRRDGAAYCWGSNATGLLGADSTTGSPLPVPVLSGLTFTTVAVGPNHACGLQADGSAYCWGRVGDGAGAASAGAVRVAP